MATGRRLIPHRFESSPAWRRTVKSSPAWRRTVKFFLSSRVAFRGAQVISARVAFRGAQVLSSRLQLGGAQAACQGGCRFQRGVGCLLLACSVQVRRVSRSASSGLEFSLRIHSYIWDSDHLSILHCHWHAPGVWRSTDSPLTFIVLSAGTPDVPGASGCFHLEGRF
jgi:hypothetical protein